jgi:predicted Zn-dependent protease
MAKSNPVDETRIADPVERTKRLRHSNAKKAAGTAKVPKQQRRRKSAVGSRNGTKPASSNQSKQQTCLDLLGRREGATIEDLKEATGWQKHSVRGFLAGAIKKKLGLTLVSEKLDAEPRRYRIPTAA